MSCGTSKPTKYTINTTKLKRKYRKGGADGESGSTDVDTIFSTVNWGGQNHGGGGHHWSGDSVAEGSSGDVGGGVGG
jgi:hypothetical protein